ncbi:MAG: SDR family oxidoreductase [Rhodospirillaceae bacterium]|nr:SDR family oxidoreductase [Rhodospirillaceae bacterium]
MTAAGSSATLKERVAIVTGGSRGIGLACAAELAACGAHVCVTGRDPKALNTAVKSIGGTAMAAVGDAADATHVTATIDAVMARFGRIDILVNNAGGPLHNGPLLSLEPQQMEDTWRFNLLGPHLWAKAVWHKSMSAHGGSIINISSLGGITLQTGMGAYSIAKAALLHMTRIMAAELGPKVRVNAIAPGIIETDATADFVAAGGPNMAAKLPMARFGKSEDIAKACRFLASDDASWITGDTLVIDGGSLVQWGRLRAPKQ